jgi:EAL domain-containing protein (putative c-di-GMP-specific phosphodiesterase class I)/ActR/RegA family two-component response regulator
MQTTTPAGLQVLIVDDEPRIVAALSRALGPLQAQITTAHDLRSARAALGDRAFDLALVDQNLPDGLGSALLRELVQLQPACARVLVTGETRVPRVMGAVNEADLHQFLAKPFSPAQALDAVGAALDQSAARLAVMRRARDPDGGRSTLSQLLDSDDLFLAWQPIVGAHGGLLGAEALLRSRRPGLETPAALLGLAHEHQLIRQVGRAVAARVAQALPRLPPGARLFVNVHPDELADPAALADQLAPMAGAADRITLELTGEALERWADTLPRRLQLLRDLGFSLALDDLGAGKGALTLLAELGPSWIKTHPSLVRGVDQRAPIRRMVQMVMAFAEASGAQVVAEGVETEAEARALAELGVPWLQGFWVARPAPLTERGLGPVAAEIAGA